MAQHVRGRATKQAHVALPEGTVEEEFGRRGFYGQATHLYRLHPPTAWTSIDGPLRPHALDLRAIAGAGRRPGPVDRRPRQRRRRARGLDAHEPSCRSSSATATAT